MMTTTTPEICTNATSLMTTTIPMTTQFISLETSAATTSMELVTNATYNELFANETTTQTSWITNGTNFDFTYYFENSTTSIPNVTITMSNNSVDMNMTTLNFMTTTELIENLTSLTTTTTLYPNVTISNLTLDFNMTTETISSENTTDFNGTILSTDTEIAFTESITTSTATPSLLTNNKVNILEWILNFINSICKPKKPRSSTKVKSAKSEGSLESIAEAVVPLLQDSFKKLNSEVMIENVDVASDLMLLVLKPNDYSILFNMTEQQARDLKFEYYKTRNSLRTIEQITVGDILNLPGPFIDYITNIFGSVPTKLTVNDMIGRLYPTYNLSYKQKQDFDRISSKIKQQGLMYSQQFMIFLNQPKNLLKCNLTVKEAYAVKEFVQASQDWLFKNQPLNKNYFAKMSDPLSSLKTLNEILAMKKNLIRASLEFFNSNTFKPMNRQKIIELSSRVDTQNILNTMKYILKKSKEKVQSFIELLNAQKKL